MFYHKTKNCGFGICDMVRRVFYNYKATTQEYKYGWIKTMQGWSNGDVWSGELGHLFLSMTNIARHVFSHWPMIPGSFLSTDQWCRLFFPVNRWSCVLSFLPMTNNAKNFLSTATGAFFSQFLVLYFFSSYWPITSVHFLPLSNNPWLFSHWSIKLDICPSTDQ